MDVLLCLIFSYLEKKRKWNKTLVTFDLALHVSWQSKSRIRKPQKLDFSFFHQHFNFSKIFTELRYPWRESPRIFRSRSGCVVFASNSFISFWKQWQGAWVSGQVGRNLERGVIHTFIHLGSKSRHHQALNVISTTLESNQTIEMNWQFSQFLLLILKNIRQKLVFDWQKDTFVLQGPFG